MVGCSTLYLLVVAFCSFLKGRLSPLGYRQRRPSKPWRRWSMTSRWTKLHDWAMLGTMLYQIECTAKLFWIKIYVAPWRSWSNLNITLHRIAFDKISPNPWRVKCLIDSIDASIKENPWKLFHHECHRLSWFREGRRFVFRYQSGWFGQDFRIWSSELSAIMSYHSSRLVPQMIVQADIPPHVNVFSTCLANVIDCVPLFCVLGSLNTLAPPWHWNAETSCTANGWLLGNPYLLFCWYWNTYIKALQN